MSVYYYWLIAALLALIIELLSGTFFLLVLAGSFAMSGLVSWLNGGEITAAVVGAISGSIGILMLRCYQQDNMRVAEPPCDLDKGKTVIVLRRTGKIGRVRYRGTEWDAILLDEGLSAGDVGYISGHEGNCMLITSHPIGNS